MDAIKQFARAEAAPEGEAVKVSINNVEQRAAHVSKNAGAVRVEFSIDAQEIERMRKLGSVTLILSELSPLQATMIESAMLTAFPSRGRSK